MPPKSENGQPDLITNATNAFISEYIATYYRYTLILFSPVSASPLPQVCGLLFGPGGLGLSACLHQGGGGHPLPPLLEAQGTRLNLCLELVLAWNRPA